MKRAITIVVLILFASTAFAQGSRTVKGFVLDEEGTALSGATVRVSGGSGSTVSEHNGFFEMQVDYSCKYLEVAHEGYIPSHAEIDGSLIVFRLKMNKDYAKETKKQRVAAERVQKEKQTAAKRELNRTTYGEQQSGFGSMVDLSYRIGMGGAHSAFGINYIVGYRINNLFFIGGGTGANFNIGAGASTRYTTTEYSNNSLTPCLTSVPIYAYFRANFLNRRFSPFFALAAGGNISGKQTLHLDLCDVKYSNTGLFVNPQLGVNFRTSTKTSLYLAVGFNGFTVPSCSEYNSHSATAKPKFASGADIHLGLTF